MSARERAAWLPPLVSLALAVLGLGLWQTQVVPMLPPEPYRPELERERLVWLQPSKGPFFCGQDLEQARLLLVGDSRVNPGVDPGDLDAQGLGPSARIWGPNALLHELLSSVATLPPRRLLVAISTGSLGRKEALVAHHVLRAPPPRFRGPDSLHQGRRWEAERRADLLAQGLEPTTFGAELAELAAALRRESLHAGLWPAAIDHRLGDALHQLRCSLVRSVSTSGGIRPGCTAPAWSAR